MREDFVTYEQAQTLKSLGFDWACYEFWDTSFCTDGVPVKIRRTTHEPKVCVVSERNSFLEKVGSDLITAPTLATVQKWLREEKKVSVEARVSNEPNAFLNDMDAIYFPSIITLSGSQIKFGLWNQNLYEGEKKWYDTYEEALSEAISYTLSILQKL